MINTERMVYCFCEMVAIPSESPDDQEFVSYLDKLFVKEGYKTQKDSFGNLIVKIPAKKSIGPPQEVPGPTEVPGPFEVTLDQWRTIVAGQRISIRSNGTYATTSFDLQKQLDAFIEKNRTLDASIKGAR